MIVEDLLPEREESVFPGYWRISAAGDCPKALLARARGELPPRAPALVTEEGRLHENDIIQRLLDKGYKVIDRQREVSVSLQGTEWPLVGHIDGIIHLPPDDLPYLLEIKSKNADRFSKVLRKGPEHFYRDYLQIQLYMVATGLERCLYICKNRDSGKLFDSIIRLDIDFVIDYLYNIFAPVVSAYTQGTELEQTCSSNPEIRRYCPFACSSQKTNLEPLPYTPEVDSTVREYFEASELISTGEALMKKVRERFTDWLIKSGHREALAGPLKVSLVRSSRRQIDNEFVRELPEEIRERLFCKTEYEYVRITPHEESNSRGE